MATTEAPVLVRARVSPSGLPSNSEPFGMSTVADASPGISRVRSANRSVSLGAPMSSATVSASSEVRTSKEEEESGSSAR